MDAADGFTAVGREARQRIEALTDELAAPAYNLRSAEELDELVARMASAGRGHSPRSHA